MSLLDKADISEQTAHERRPLPGTARERREAKAVSAVARMRPADDPDVTRGAPWQPHVYIAYSAGRLKIGTSINVHSRERNLQGHSPLPLTVIHTFPGGADIERKLHACLAGERLHGEWFRMSPEMRKLLDNTLCRAGQRKFKKAEAEFRKWLREVTA